MAEQKETRKDAQKGKPKMPDEQHLDVDNKEVQITFESVKADVPTIYVNNARFGMTEWDMNIELGEIHSANPAEKKLLIIPRARLIMSVSFATRFFQAMKANLDDYYKLLEQRVQEQEEAQKSQAEQPKAE